VSLKRQLLLVSLLVLLVPLAAVQFALELDDILRQQAQRQLQQQASRLATLAGDELLGQPPQTNSSAAIYVPLQDGTLLLDGYGDDWPGYDSAEPFPPAAEIPLSSQQPWQQSPPRQRRTNARTLLAGQSPRPNPVFAGSDSRSATTAV
jgi:hypothetical protein